jgi:hypothetical protein
MRPLCLQVISWQDQTNMIGDPEADVHRQDQKSLVEELPVRNANIFPAVATSRPGENDSGSRLS